MRESLERLINEKALLQFAKESGVDNDGTDAINASATSYNRYGSDVHKQVYIYGGLDRSPTEFQRNFGMSWGIGGWLLTPFLGKLGLEGMLRLRERVVTELTTTFASHYTNEVSLTGAIDPAAIAVYAQQATGQKFLIRPTLG
jgi:NADPH2:quinone reductase